MNGLTRALDSVAWNKGAVDVTTLPDYSSNYVLSDGNLVGTSQTISLQVIDAGLTDTDYFCVVTSNEHGQTNMETSVRLETFSEFLKHILKFIHFHIILNFIL